MSWMGSVLNYVQAPLSGTPEFRWLQSGMGTKYLLITRANGQPSVQIFGTEDLSNLLEELTGHVEIDAECVLLGVETWEVTSQFFRLDPKEAIERLTGCK